MVCGCWSRRDVKNLEIVTPLCETLTVIVKGRCDDDGVLVESRKV